MPLREISNNAGPVKGHPDRWVKKQQTARVVVNVEAPPEPTIQTKHDGRNIQLEENLKNKKTNSIARKEKNALVPGTTAAAIVEEDATSGQIFIECVPSWGTFVANDIQHWLNNPDFIQSKSSLSCCRLCGKSVRMGGSPDANNQVRIQRHSQGAHHQKTFRLMENLKKLQIQDKDRLRHLLTLLDDTNNLPPTHCTDKQSLAFYHNITIQAVASKKCLEGIIQHHRNRFLKNKIHVQTEANKSIPLSVWDIDTNPRNTTKQMETPATATVGNEENIPGATLTSPVVGLKSHASNQVDTPFYGASKLSAWKEACRDEPSLLSPEPKDDKKADNAFESPASDITSQSELDWMGTINESDDVLVDEGECKGEHFNDMIGENGATLTSLATLEFPVDIDSIIEGESHKGNGLILNQCAIRLGQSPLWKTTVMDTALPSPDKDTARIRAATCIAQLAFIKP